MQKTGVYFHNLFNKKVWDIINNKFQNFPKKIKEQLNLANVELYTPPLIDEKTLLKVHTHEYFWTLRRRWDYEGARRTVGGCVEAARRIMEGRLHNALCFGVAAGHHAESASAWGGTYASVIGPIMVNLEELYGADVRIAVLDTDSHHGNGTREVTYGHRNVLHVCFCSNDHIEDNGTKICVDSGRATTDDAYLAKMKSEFVPRVDNFKPEIIVHLLGHDTAEGDYGSRGLSQEFFLNLVRIVKQTAERVCKGHYLINTHGGYNLEVCEYIHPKIIEILACSEKEKNSF